MQAEQIEIAQFLAQHPPFNDLPIKALNELAQQVEVAYFRAQTEILQLGQDIADLYVIRSGSVEMYRRNGELYNRLAVGGIFGQMGLLMNRKVRFPATALEDTLVYCINVELFNRYCDEFDAFADYFETDGNVRLHQAIVEQADSNDLTTAKVKSLIHRDVVTVLTTSTVQDVAKLMSEEAVSSVLVTDINKPVNDDPEEDDGQVVGIITDRDLRNKVVAPGLSFDTQAQHIQRPLPNSNNQTPNPPPSRATLSVSSLLHNPIKFDVVLQGCSFDMIESLQNSESRKSGCLPRPN